MKNNEFKYANQMLYSDVRPFEIVEHRTEKKIIIRGMLSELIQSPSFAVGGFAAHAENDEQEWKIVSDETARTFAIRQHRDGQWYDAHGNRYRLHTRPVCVYDYNF